MGQARKSRLVTSTDAGFCEGVQTWPQLAALATLTINNAAFESRELEDVVFYCGVQLTMLKLHNVELVFSCGGDDGGQGEGTDGVWDIGWWVGSVLASSPVSLI